MKNVFAALAVVSVIALTPAVAQEGEDLGVACAAAAEEGRIELPEGMSVEAAKAVCACIGESAEGEVAQEFLDSLAIFDLEERMGSLSEAAMALFQSCAS